jgi:hypothetical protein
MRMITTKLTLLPFALMLGGSILAPVATVAQSSQSDSALQNEITNKALNKSKLKNIRYHSTMALPLLRVPWKCSISKKKRIGVFTG